MDVTESFRNGVFLVDQGCCNFSLVNISAAHFQKMAEAVVEQLFHQFFCIVDLSNGGNGKASQVGMDNEGLGIKIRDTADA